MYMNIRSQMNLIMGQVIPDQSVLSALEIQQEDHDGAISLTEY